MMEPVRSRPSRNIVVVAVGTIVVVTQTHISSQIIFAELQLVGIFCSGACEKSFIVSVATRISSMYTTISRARNISFRIVDINLSGIPRDRS